MQETMNKAIDSLRDEMAANANDAALQAVGAMVGEMLKADPANAEKVLEAGKSLKGAYEAMQTEAEKRMNGGSCVCIAPDEAEKLIAAYYGMMIAADKGEREETQAPAEDGALDLDALLGGL